MSQRVAVINTNEDIVEMLSTALEQAGFDVASRHVTDFKRGRTDFEEFLDQHDPKVIVYDIAPPYRENWEFFQTLSRSEAGRNCQYVLTTTNKKLTTEAAGKDVGAFEISEKPYDLNVIVDSVRRNLKAA
jgi:DNA-binding NtrC family response regulator